MSDAVPAPSGTSGIRGTPAAVAVALGTLVANVLVYGVFLVLARALDPAQLGAFSALGNLVVIAGVAALAAQLVAAREVARAPDPADPAPVVSALRTGALVGLVGTGVLLLAVPVVTAVLDLPGPAPALLLAAVVLPTYLSYATLGCLQGRHRFIAFGTLLVVMAGGRFAAAVLGSALDLGVTGVLALTVASVWLAAGFALLLVRDALPGVLGTSGTWSRAVVHGAAATSALLVVTNIDTPLARALLDPRAAGEYAVLAVFEKAAFWGPAFLATLLYPRMATATGRRTAVAAASATAGLGLVGVGVAALLADTLVEVVGGPDYAHVAGLVPWFVAAGAAWSTAQVLVYWRLSRADHRLGWVVWVVAALVAVTVALRHEDLAQVVSAVLGGGLLVVLYGVVLLFRHGAAGRAEALAAAPLSTLP